MLCTRLSFSGQWLEFTNIATRKCQIKWLFPPWVNICHLIPQLFPMLESAKDQLLVQEHKEFKTATETCLQGWTNPQRCGGKAFPRWRRWWYSVNTAYSRGKKGWEGFRTRSFLFWRLLVMKLFPLLQPPIAFCPFYLHLWEKPGFSPFVVRVLRLRSQQS